MKFILSLWLTIFLVMTAFATFIAGSDSGLCQSKAARISIIFPGFQVGCFISGHVPRVVEWLMKPL